MAHIPVRECICCRMKTAKSELVRIVKCENGFSVDRTGKQQGRGGYICASCLDNPISAKKRPLARAFREKVPDAVYETLFAAEAKR